MVQGRHRPRVSVLMTTHNGAPLIAESIGSVLVQTMEDLELVIVDDASTDTATVSSIEDFASRDPRITLIRAERNLGVVGARNLGVAACRGTYLAALDHDDLCHPDRLAIQAAFLDRNPGIVLVGSQVAILEAGERRVTHRPGGRSPALARWMLHVDNPLTWSSVMLRMDAARQLDPFVRTVAEYADDFDLYHRMMRLGGIAWLDDVLTTYRLHATNTSRTRAETLLRNATTVLAGVYRPWLGAEAERAAALVVRHVSDRRPITDAATLDQLGAVLSNVLAHYCADNDLSPDDRAAIEAHAAQTWWGAVRAAVRRGRPWLIRYRSRQPSLRSGPGPGWGDLLTSMAVGFGRAVTGQTRGRD